MDRRDLLATLAELSGLSAGVRRVLNSPRLRGPIVRAVHYHGTPHSLRDNLARHFEYYASHFRVLSERDVSQFVAGHFELDRVGLIITFDDGLRSNYSVAAELLDEFGLPGIFFLPVAFIDLAAASPDSQQRFYLGETKAGMDGDVDREIYEPMSWNEARNLLARGHAVGSHSLTHISLGRIAERDRLVREIVESKRLLEEHLLSEVISFCWPEGALSDYSRTAYEMIREHYRLGFTTFAGPLRKGGDPHAIHRSNVEAHLSLARVRAATNGLTELYFLGRRRRFETVVT